MICNTIWPLQYDEGIQLANVETFTLLVIYHLFYCDLYCKMLKKVNGEYICESMMQLYLACLMFNLMVDLFLN